jgi:LacI family transcriptional regulator
LTVLTDVARIAAVSRTTASRVLNGSGSVSSESRARVRRAMRELGYVPNSVARQLRSQRTMTIALVITDIRNPYFTTIASGVQDAARSRGYVVIFFSTHGSEAEEAQCVRALTEHRVDGAILVTDAPRTRSVGDLGRHGIATVLVDGRAQPVEVDEVRSDGRAGAREAVRHLVQLGHSRIAILTGPAGAPASTEPVAGCLEALAEANGAGGPAQVLFGEFSQSSGHAMTGAILGRSPRPTAILAVSRSIAFGAVGALGEAGVAIPAEMSIVAFDDQPLDVSVDPFLTTVSPPAYEMGIQATKMLLQRLSGEATGTPEAIALPSTVTVRRSTAPPPSS